MARTVYLPPFLAEKYVAIATDCRVTGPFVTGKSDETAGFVMVCSQFVEEFPEGIVDLEIVRLVAGDVEECLVAGEIEIGSRGANTN